MTRLSRKKKQTHNTVAQSRNNYLEHWSQVLLYRSPGTNFWGGLNLGSSYRVWWLLLRSGMIPLGCRRHRALGFCIC